MIFKNAVRLQQNRDQLRDVRLKLSSRWVERRGKMGNFLYIYKGYMATLLMRVASEMRGRLGLFAPATSQDLFLVCILASGSYFALLIGYISYPCS